MPVERSAGIIFFRVALEGRKYLIVRSSAEHHKKESREFWDIPKGRLEKGEKGIDAALREGREEAGVEDFDIVPEFKHTVRYFTRREGKSVPKFVAVFLAEAHDEKIKLSWEHDKFLWVTFDEAISKLTTMKPALEAAEKFLSERR